MPQERNTQASALAYLRGIPGCVVRKLHITAFGTVGDPDLYGCYRGRMFVVELKQEGKQPTKIQEMRLEEWRRAGAAAMVAHSTDELRAQFTALLLGGT